MSKVKNILMTCAGGGAPLFLANSLRDTYNIVLVDAEDGNLLKHFGYTFEKVPYGNSPDFISVLEDLCARYSIDCIVPGADEELLPISQFCALHPEIIAVLPSAAFIELCLNKKKLMGALAETSISYLQGFISPEEIRYPAIVKPIYGRGSRQVHTIHTPEELEGYLKLYKKEFSEILVQPVISGEEYTVSVIVNNRNKIISIVPKRVIVKRGITRIAVVEEQSVIENICEMIVEKMNPCGPFNAQLKLLNGTVYIFEINPRLSTTAVLTQKALGNEVELYIQTFNQEKVDRRGYRSGIYLYRYDENVFIEE